MKATKHRSEFVQNILSGCSNTMSVNTVRWISSSVGALYDSSIKPVTISLIRNLVQTREDGHVNVADGNSADRDEWKRLLFTSTVHDRIGEVELYPCASIEFAWQRDTFLGGTQKASAKWIQSFWHVGTLKCHSRFMSFSKSHESALHYCTFTSSESSKRSKKKHTIHSWLLYEQLNSRNNKKSLSARLSSS